MTTKPSDQVFVVLRALKKAARLTVDSLIEEADTAGPHHAPLLRDSLRDNKAWVEHFIGTILLTAMTGRIPVKSPQKPPVAIGDLDVSIRTINALANGSPYHSYRPIETVSELTKFSEQDLRRIPNIGNRTLTDIKEALAEHGLHLAKGGTE